MIDIHCHIIPGVDDGPNDMETTLKMAKIAEASGIKTIVATPHYYPGYYENNFKDTVKSVDQLNCTLEALKIKVKIIPGQEILLDKNTLSLFFEGIIGGINGTNYMLVELPMDREPKEALEAIYELRLRGIIPIIAHPERYFFIIKDPSAINPYIEEGCLFQLNSGSILGQFGNGIRNLSERLLQNNIYSFIASDAHSVWGRTTDMREARNKLSSCDSLLNTYFDKNSKLLLSNGEIKTEAVKVIKKKSIFNVFR